MYKAILTSTIAIAEVPSAPEAPIEATEITATSVSIKWKPPKSDGGTPLTAYIIERRDATRMTWIKVDKVKPNITTYCIQDLVTNNEYFFRVIAENAEGMSPPLDSPKFKPVRKAGQCQCLTVDCYMPVKCTSLGSGRLYHMYNLAADIFLKM